MREKGAGGRGVQIDVAQGNDKEKKYWKEIIFNVNIKFYYI